MLTLHVSGQELMLLTINFNTFGLPMPEIEVFLTHGRKGEVDSLGN